MTLSIFSHLRARLLLLVILAAVPIFAVTFYTGLSHRQQAITAAQEDALRVAQLGSFYQSRAIDATHQLLIALAHVPDVQPDNPQVCSAFLANLLQQYSVYASFAVTDLKGDVVCSALPLNQPSNIADRPYFQRVISGGDFATGSYRIGGVSGKPILSAGYPLFDADDQIQGVVIAALDLSWFNQLVAEAQLPPQSVVTMMDDNGLILARFPDPQQWVGQTLPDAPLIETVMVEDEGTAELTGLDGVSRLYGFTTLNAGDGAAHVTVGVPTTLAYAEANQTLIENVAWVSAVFVLVLAATWLVSDRFVLRPVAGLVRAARTLSAGDFGPRVGELAGPAEMRELGKAFDEMADSLQIREREVSAMQTFLQRSASRLEILHEIDQTILATQSASEAAKVALAQLQSLVACQYASVALTNLKEEKAMVIATSNGDAPFPEASEVKINLAALQQELMQGQIRIVEDLLALPERTAAEQQLLEHGIRAYVNLPLMSQGDLVGVLTLSLNQPGTLSPDDRVVAQEIANQLAVAIQNARLFEQIKRHAAELERRVEERTEDLRRTKNHIEAILNNSSDAVILARADGTIQQTNPAFHHLFGYQADEMHGKKLLAFVRFDHSERLIEVLHEVVVTRKSKRVELVCYRNDGRTFDADFSISRTPERDSKSSNIICSVRDMSERKRLEAELRNSLAKEKELNELKSHFVSMLSHDFRNPLAVIQTSSGLLIDYNERLSDERKRGHLDKIQTQVGLLVELLDDMLSLMSAEAVGIRFAPQPCDVVALCQNIVNEMQQTSSEHQFDFTSSGDCGEAMLDEKLVRKILTNLLSNAIKYSPGGGPVKFDLHCENAQIILKIEDEGIGIPEADQEHLFEAFHRARNVGDINGTGLGLAIVKRALDAHGGSITFKSQVGSGSTFSVSLPQHP